MLWLDQGHLNRENLVQAKERWYWENTDKHLQTKLDREAKGGGGGEGGVGGLLRVVVVCRVGRRKCQSVFPPGSGWVLPTLNLSCLLTEPHILIGQKKPDQCRWGHFPLHIKSFPINISGALTKMFQSPLHLGSCANQDSRFHNFRFQRDG